MPRVKKSRKRVKLAFKRKTKSYKRRKSIRKKKSKRRLTYRRKQTGSSYQYQGHPVVRTLPHQFEDLDVGGPISTKPSIQSIKFSDNTNAEEGILKKALENSTTNAKSTGARPGITVNAQLIEASIKPDRPGRTTDDTNISDNLKNVKIEIFNTHNLNPQPLNLCEWTKPPTDYIQVCENKATELVFNDYLLSETFRRVDFCTWGKNEPPPPCQKQARVRGAPYISEIKEKLTDFKLIKISDNPKYFIIEAVRKTSHRYNPTQMGTLKFYFTEQQLIKLKAQINRSSDNIEILIPDPDQEDN